jgi:NAD(P)-dependent dehydrogenase (short-subunit alcohol dehydrogenase family)
MPDSTLVVLGAGPGMGRAVARRFGSEGFRVALVARNPERLDAIRAELAGEGIDAAGFPADLADPSVVPDLVRAITDRFGPIDVVHHAPSGPDWLRLRVHVLEAGPQSFDAPLDLLVRTPAAVVRAVLPGMTERGHGAILSGLAISAGQPYPELGNISAAGAAARSYLQSLHAALEGTGVFAGLVQVGGLVADSLAAELFATMRPGEPLPPAIDPADLAAAVWELYARRDRFEQIVTPRTSPEPGQDPDAPARARPYSANAEKAALGSQGIPG